MLVLQGSSACFYINVRPCGVVVYSHSLKCVLLIEGIFTMTSFLVSLILVFCLLFFVNLYKLLYTRAANPLLLHWPVCNGFS
jgi:hypothetical protein